MAALKEFPFRLIIVSNRGPYRFTPGRGIRHEKSIGGLVTSILPMLERTGGTWIAWGEPEGRFASPPKRPTFDLRYLSLTPEQVRDYYQGLSNGALWPLSHYFLGRVRYDPQEWEVYEEVNHLFAKAALEEAGEQDVIWIHDYQLTRTPFYIRQQRPNARLLFFWHIPFPAVEIFRTLPWREQVLKGMLACDLVGFHIPEFANNFIEAAADVLGAQVSGETITYEGRTTQVIARPIGIDFDLVDKEARSSRTEARVHNINRTFEGQKLILGVERMDYTKGVLERLEGLEQLLQQRSDLHGKLTLLQIVTPSRLEVEAYRQKKREIDEAVGRINGQFSDGVWSPIRYLYRSVSLSELVAYYRASDIALVTPLRDGLNLVAKEYVATRIHNDGVLILSEFAGVAYQLPEALLTNPYSREDMAKSLERALHMSLEEQHKRMTPMRQRVKEFGIEWWAQEFLNWMGAERGSHG